MSKRTMFTTITPLPPGVSREVVLETLHDHLAMIDLNPAHETRKRMEKAPAEATPEEYHTTWYEITDKISYFPGVKGKVSFKACFHDLTNGLQTHCYAPLGLDLKEKWTLCGNLPHEPSQPSEIGIGAPISGLYLREDVDMRCNFLMTRFVRQTLKDCLAALVARLLVKSQITEAANINSRLTYNGSINPPHSPVPSYASVPGSPQPMVTPPMAGGMSSGMTLPPHGKDTAAYINSANVSPNSMHPNMQNGYPSAAHGANPHVHQQHLHPYGPSSVYAQPPPQAPLGHMVEMPDTQTGDTRPQPQTFTAELPS